MWAAAGTVPGMEAAQVWALIGLLATTQFALVAQIRRLGDRMNDGFGYMHQQFGEMHRRFGEVDRRFGEVDRQIGELRGDLAALRGDVSRHIDRDH